MHSEISSGLLDPKSVYYVLRKDRADSAHGGGVAAFINRTLNVCVVAVESRFESLELLCFDLLFGTNTVRFFVVYRPPSCGIDSVNYMNLLIACLKQYSDGVQTTVMIGDFNLPRIDWNSVTSSGDSVSKLFLDFVITNSYIQFVNFPTRGNNILDLILANDEQVVNCVSSNVPIGHSDHCVVDFKVVSKRTNLPSANPAEGASRYNWYASDFEPMSYHFDCVDWDSFICHNPQAASSWAAFLDLTWTIIDMFVPLRSNRGNFKKRPKEVRRLMVKKRQLWRKHRASPSDLKALWEYRDCVNRFRAKCREMTKQEEKSVVDAVFGRILNNPQHVLQAYLDERPQLC